MRSQAADYHNWLAWQEPFSTPCLNDTHLCHTVQVPMENCQQVLGSRARSLAGHQTLFNPFQVVWPLLDSHSSPGKTWKRRNCWNASAPRFIYATFLFQNVQKRKDKNITIRRRRIICHYSNALGSSVIVSVWIKSKWRCSPRQQEYLAVIRFFMLNTREGIDRSAASLRFHKSAFLCTKKL